MNTETGKPNVFYCSDDFGMTPIACDRILECNEKGVLNKISIMSNTALDDIKDRLAQFRDTVFSVHISLVEGQCVSGEAAALLTDSDGFFRYSFGGILLKTLLPGRAEFLAAVKAEIRGQIVRAMEFLPEGTPLFLDTHQHVHMIPAVFRVLMDVIAEDGLNVRYLRIPAEPLQPFLLTPSLYREYLSVNLIKQVLLKFFGLVNRPLLKKSGIPTALFFGIMFSGNMNLARVQKILPKYLTLAEKRGCDIEVLFHVGYTLAGEPLFDERKTSFHSFYYSEGRIREYSAVMALKP